MQSPLFSLSAKAKVERPDPRTRAMLIFVVGQCIYSSFRFHFCTPLSSRCWLQQKEGGKVSHFRFLSCTDALRVERPS